MLDSNKSINFNKKSYFKTFVYVSNDKYDFTIQFIRYALYRTIREHILYANTIRNFLHMILYILNDIDNYASTNVIFGLPLPFFSFPQLQSTHFPSLIGRI